MYVQQSPLYLFSLYSWAPDNILSQIPVVSLTQHVDHPTDSPDLVCHVALRGVWVVHHGWRGGGPQLGVSQLCRSVSTLVCHPPRQQSAQVHNRGGRGVLVRPFLCLFRDIHPLPFFSTCVEYNWILQNNFYNDDFFSSHCSVFIFDNIFT